MFLPRGDAFSGNLCDFMNTVSPTVSQEPQWARAWLEAAVWHLGVASIEARFVFGSSIIGPCQQMHKSLLNLSLSSDHL